MYMNSIYVSITIFLCSLERIWIPIIIQATIVPFHALWCCIFAKRGIEGIAIALNITDFLSLALLLLYINYNSEEDAVLKEAWVKISMESLEDFQDYSIKAFSSFIIQAMVVWSYFIIIIATGWIGSTDYAAYTIVMTIMQPLILYHLSFSYAISALVGQQMGQYSISSAQKIFKVATTFCFASSILFSIIVYSYPSSFVKFFETSPKIA